MSGRHRYEGERWFEFEEHVEYRRPVYVAASSIAEARRLRTDGEVVEDYPPNFPDVLRWGRGRVAADQGYVDDLAVEER